MDFKEIFSKKRIIFLFLFFALVYFGNKVNFSPLLGAENQFFTLFQFFGPIAGAFLGPIYGIISVFFSEIVDFLVVGKEFTLINLLRLLPMLFAVYYFGSRKKLMGIFVPLLCIFLFIFHPIGQQVWFYSLFWLIPILGKILPEKIPGKLFFRSYGATFTAHAVGATLWLYSVPSTAGMWLSLIPITAYERFLFGLGIAGSFVIFNTLLDYMVEKWKINLPLKVLFVERKYSLINLLHLRKIDS